MSKGNKPNDDVLKNLDYYQKVAEAEKKLPSNTISLEERKNHKGFDHGIAKLESEISDQQFLEIEQNKVAGRDFKFKIYDYSLMRAPCYRFDSDGDAHMNKVDVNLPQRMVETPHFHKYNTDGVEIAYHTPEWQENKEELLSDQKAALASFAKEENIIYDSLPDFVTAGEFLRPEDTILDPLKREDFNE